MRKAGRIWLSDNDTIAAEARNNQDGERGPQDYMFCSILMES